VSVPDVESISLVRRRWGKLYVVITSGGRRFLVLRDPSSESYLEAGAPLDGEALAALAGPLARTAGLALAYRLLGVRDRTEREMRGALDAEGIQTPEVIDEIVGTLRRQGYLDDRRLASQYVQYLAKHKPSGAHLVRRKLREAGVSEEILEEEIREALPLEQEREMAEELARRKLASMKGMKTGSSKEQREQAVRRIHGFLSRRGFSERVVGDICAKILRGKMPGEHHDA
jgi:regulatory protein